MCEATTVAECTVVDLSAVVENALRRGERGGAAHRILFDTGMLHFLQQHARPESTDDPLPHETGYGSFGNAEGAKIILSRIIAGYDYPVPHVLEAIEQMRQAVA